MTFNYNLPSPSERVAQSNRWPDIELWIKRDDLIHPVISGNKARKLALLPSRIAKQNPSYLVTMAGNRSNFLHALSYLCYQQSIPLKAIIRGPQPEAFGPTLSDVLSWKTECHFVSRETFRNLRSDPELRHQICGAASGMWLPEGGSDIDAVRSISNAVHELTFVPDFILLPVGTGATALGVALGVQSLGWTTQVIGVVVLKGATQIKSSMLRLSEKLGEKWPSCLSLDHDFCDRGFGKINDALRSRQAQYQELFKVPFEPVYTTKMLDAFMAYNEQGKFLPQNKVLIWHTGGLQGN